MSRPMRCLAASATLALAVAAGPVPAAAGAAPVTATGRTAPVRVVVGAGTPTAAGTGGAYAYDAALVPDGAAVALLSLSGPARTRTLLAVRGLLPGRTYGAHLHVNACGADPADAGGHYQQMPDPQQPSTDPDYANDRNEVWLDVDTNAAGAGVAIARNPWRYRAAPGSVVLHAHATSTDADTPGAAGARVACVTLRAS